MVVGDFSAIAQLTCPVVQLFESALKEKEKEGEGEGKEKGEGEGD